MPVSRAELVAEFTIHPSGEGRLEPHVEAGVAAARASGLALEVGPLGTALAGPRPDVLASLNDVLQAAIDAGAEAVEIRVEVQTRMSEGGPRSAT
ncbi:MAG: thiamine-binding protein [Actinobacteria bacterium]|nr:thiamine-binding protein [Actinomycetota bacterium]